MAASAGLGVGLGYHGAGGRGHTDCGIGTDGGFTSTVVSETWVPTRTLRPVALPRGSANSVGALRNRPWPFGPLSASQLRSGWVQYDLHAHADQLGCCSGRHREDERDRRHGFGGTADDYEIGNERVFKTADNSQGLTYAEAARRAIELGGKFSGEEYPDDINPLTQIAVQAWPDRVWWVLPKTIFPCRSTTRQRDRVYGN